MHITVIICVSRTLGSGHVTAGRSSVGDASSVAPGSSGCPYGCAAVPDYGVDVQRQNTSRAHQQAEG